MRQFFFQMSGVETATPAVPEIEVIKVHYYHEGGDGIVKTKNVQLSPGRLIPVSTLKELFELSVVEKYNPETKQSVAIGYNPSTGDSRNPMPAGVNVLCITGTLASSSKLH
jgi:hypothetical protein